MADANGRVNESKMQRESAAGAGAGGKGKYWQEPSNYKIQSTPGSLAAPGSGGLKGVPPLPPTPADPRLDFLSRIGKC